MFAACVSKDGRPAWRQIPHLHRLADVSQLHSVRFPLPLCWMRASLKAASSCPRQPVCVCVTSLARALGQSQSPVVGLQTVCDLISTWHPTLRPTCGRRHRGQTFTDCLLTPGCVKTGRKEKMACNNKATLDTSLAETKIYLTCWWDCVSNKLMLNLVPTFVMPFAL